MQLEEATEMACLINAYFVKCQSTNQTQRPAREKLHSMQEVCADDLNVPYPANYMIRYGGISVQNIPQPINFLLYALKFLPKYPLSQSP